MLEDLLLQLFDAAGALVGCHADHVVGDIDLGLDDAVPALVHRQPAAVPLGQIQPALASGVLLEDRSNRLGRNALTTGRMLDDRTA